MTAVKKKLRQHVRETLARIARPENHARSLQAIDRMVALEEFRAARIVMLYLPMPEEVDTLPLAEACWQAGKVVLVPRCKMNPRTMDACRIDSLSEGLVSSYYGILEPHDGHVAWPPGQIDFIVVPGLAFDSRGGRLGRGAGFYDRFLAQTAGGCTACGIAFHEQLIDSVPVLDHDERIDILVTDKEVLDFRRLDEKTALRG